MQGRAVLPNQPQVGIGDGRRPERNDFLLSWLENSEPRRNEHVLPRLEDGGIDNGGPENGLLNNLEDGRHLVAGPVVALNPAGGIEDEEVFLHASLQQMEQEDLRAVRDVLELPIPKNVITAQHLWQIMRNLRAILPKEGPYRIFYFQAEYARILRRTARVMTIPSREMYETARVRHPLGFDTLFQALQNSTPDCPIEYGQCLDKLCDHLTAGAYLMQGADGVFIIKDREEFGNSLRSLAARLTSVE